MSSWRFPSPNQSACTLEVGCAFVYVPPNESSTFRVRQCERLGVAIVFTEEEDDCFNAAGVEKTCIQLNGRTIALSLLRRSQWIEMGADIAYVMQTSGTTGTPKIIRVPHTCILPNIIDFRKRLEMTESDTVLLLSPLTFDPSMVEMFLALSSGAKLLIVPSKLKLDLPDFTAVLAQHRPTVVQMTPSLLQLLPIEFVRESLLGADSFVRCMLIGGEPFPISFMQKNRHAHNKTRIFNVYGTTEVSCWATCRELTQSLSQFDDVDLGEPLLGTTVCVRDGFLWIGGAERRCFVDNETEAPELRCTGDRVEIDRNGRIVFVGRDDDQLKRSGMRISLTQIEQLVNSSGLTIGSAACLDPTSKELLLFVCLSEKHDSNWRNDITALLKADLPRYARPTSLLAVQSFPVTKHGKLDKSALLRMWRATVDQSYSSTAIVSFLGDMLDGQAIIDHSATLKTLGVDSLGAARLAAEVDRLSGTSRVTLIAQLLDAKTTVADLIGLARRTVDQIDSSYPKAKRPRLLEGTDGASVGEHSELAHQKHGDSSNSEAENLRASDFNGVVAAQNSEPSASFEIVWAWDSGKCIDASPVVTKSITGEVVAFIGSHSGKFAAVLCENGSIKWCRQLPDRIEATCAVNEDIVAFGCFDGYVYFLSAETGEEIWRYKSGDAVKSTPIFYDQSVIVGSHDRTIYRLDYQNKSCLWSRLLDGGILSSPCVSGTDRQRMVFVATLASTIFALNWIDGAQVWSIKLAKPVFSHLQSLPFSNDQSALIVADVSGRISLLNCDDGAQLVSDELESSIFGAPFVVRTSGQCWRLYLGTDDGRLCCMRLTRRSQTPVYLWNIAVEWTKRLTTGLTRSPLAFGWDRIAEKCLPFYSHAMNEWPLKGSVSSYNDTIGDLRDNDLCSSQTLCCVAIARDGVGVLLNENGVEMGEFRLPGACFSSPVVVDGGVVVGCRDNNLYYLKLHSLSKSAPSLSLDEQNRPLDERASDR
uniref:AMP-dependent synthetase/ligase domain-containing protein n=1 Tax=Plectus sambesii TaxID=2011161 RepID=A0A914W2S5_9BILA